MSSNLDSYIAALESSNDIRAKIEHDKPSADISHQIRKGLGAETVSCILSDMRNQINHLREDVNRIEISISKGIIAALEQQNKNHRELMSAMANMSFQTSDSLTEVSTPKPSKATALYFESEKISTGTKLYAVFIMRLLTYVQRTYAESYHKPESVYMFNFKDLSSIVHGIIKLEVHADGFINDIPVIKPSNPAFSYAAVCMCSKLPGANVSFGETHIIELYKNEPQFINSCMEIVKRLKKCHGILPPEYEHYLLSINDKLVFNNELNLNMSKSNVDGTKYKQMSKLSITTRNEYMAEIFRELH
jgi:hypothetical protein